MLNRVFIILIFFPLVFLCQAQFEYSDLIYRDNVRKLTIEEDLYKYTGERTSDISKLMIYEFSKDGDTIYQKIIYSNGEYLSEKKWKFINGKYRIVHFRGWRRLYYDSDDAVKESYDYYDNGVIKSIETHGNKHKGGIL